MRWLAFYAQPGSSATPDTAREWDAIDLSNGGRLILARFHSPDIAQAWVQSVQGVIFLPRRARPLPPAAITVLAAFGVLAGDTVDDALAKIAAQWPHPGLWDHY